MRIATYNLNGINGRLPVLLRWLKEYRPDIACLQELFRDRDDRGFRDRDDRGFRDRDDRGFQPASPHGVSSNRFTPSDLSVGPIS